jgi:hypothetical protein
VVLLRKLGKDRSDELARSTPRGGEVNHHLHDQVYMILSNPTARILTEYSSWQSFQNRSFLLIKSGYQFIQNKLAQMSVRFLFMIISKKNVFPD